MTEFEFEGQMINIERRGEFVDGVLEGSKYGSHYNARWVNSDGQHFVGVVEDKELKRAIEKGHLGADDKSSSRT